jgi:undecaprenyl diphosphate synthase
MSESSRPAFPESIAIIMDGNGRWATRRGLPRIMGHRRGVEAVRTVVRAAKDLGVKRLTLYAFSQENWKRPKSEVGELMRLLERYIRNELAEMIEEGVRIKAIGRLHELRPDIQALLAEAVRKTRDNETMTLTFALSYGGRQDIVDAARAAARDVAEGRLALETIDEKSFTRYLSTADEPDPDLLIRTGGETRVSNFLLWQIAYTEIYVTGTLWPDFGRAALEEAIQEYASRERRFGLTSEQIGGMGKG